MTTRTFERELILKDETSVEKLMSIVTAEPAGKPFSKRPQTEDNRRKSEELLKRLSLR